MLDWMRIGQRRRGSARSAPLVFSLVASIPACDKTDSSDEGAIVDTAEACAQVIEAPECAAVDACTFSAANAEIVIDDAGECVSTELPFDDDDALGMCAEGDEGVLAGATVGGVYYHQETGRVFVYGIRPEPPLGWDFCGCGTGFPPACKCMDECS